MWSARRAWLQDQCRFHGPPSVDSVIARLDLAGNRFKNTSDQDKIVIPGRAEREPQMCNCTSGSGPSDHPGMTTDKTNMGITDHDAA